MEKAGIPIALGNPDDFNGLIPHPGWKGLYDHIPLLSDSFPVPQGLEPLNMRFLLGRPRPCSAHHPREILLVESRHLSFSCQGKIHSRLLLLQILLEITGITVHTRTVDFPDRGRHFIEKISVMRDHKNSTPVILQLLLQPLDHLMVQMVCRLIQNKKIARGEQGCSKSCSFPLATGEGIR